MIRYYCQYSYGGFKTFRIKGEQHEALTQEVTAEEKFEFPDLADLYFNHGGAKLLYRYFDDNTIALIVREIPGPGRDTDNRQINCAIQFIGDASDRVVLDRLCIKIANDISRFESDFADMFDMRGGLFFEGDKLASLVAECQVECSYEGDSKLLQVRGRKGTIILFVPFSDRFGYDEKTTEKVISELNLSVEATEPDRLLSIRELKKIQNFIEMKPLPVKDDAPSESDSVDTGESPTVDDLKEKLEAKEKELAQKTEECSRLRATAIESTRNLNNVRAEYDEWRQKGKLLLYIGGGILSLSLLSNIINFFF